MYSNTEYRSSLRLQKVESAKRTMMSDIREICPQATIRISKEKFEDEDALFYVYVPKSAIDSVRDFVHKKTLDILLEEDVDIAILVNELM